MLIVLFLIFLLMIGIGIKIQETNSEMLEFMGIGGITIGCFCEIILLFFLIWAGICISQLKISDQKITMYEEENNKIQQSVSEIVENYKKYENDTYSKSLKNLNLEKTDIILLTQIYPNLKSNDIVKTQIKIYQENNK